MPRRQIAKKIVEEVVASESEEEPFEDSEDEWKKPEKVCEHKENENFCT